MIGFVSVSGDSLCKDVPKLLATLWASEESLAGAFLGARSQFIAS